MWRCRRFAQITMKTLKILTAGNMKRNGSILTPVKARGHGSFPEKHLPM